VPGTKQINGIKIPIGLARVNSFGFYVWVGFLPTQSSNLAHFFIELLCVTVLLFI
jgi:hypothetical protein